ncbi:MAG: UDP-glucose/GDP-mannose dehydrogenase family protein [Chloroflexi bacterium]|nr:UDP-glucose/GDP-mannose dehydrogenase family protein [Chloroflexota bacterium]
MRKITVIGTGYVGLVTGACFADLGNAVRCIDIDERKIAMLREGQMPIYEPGLAELVVRNVRARRLSFTSDYPEGLRDTDFAFIAVNTPSGISGEADMSQVRQAAEGIGENIHKETVIVNRSTVPIGTGDMVASIVRRANGHVPFSVVSNPEFTREGQAVQDFLHPDRIVLGATDRVAAEQVAQLYASFSCPIIITDLNTAEMIKYASNAFLATRVAFINEISAICEKVGADVKEVARGMGLDTRIGLGYLEAGLGYGGSCLPKDVRALEHMAAIHGCHPQLLRAVIDINRDQRRLVVQRLRELLETADPLSGRRGLEGRVVGVLGLSFKPGTDDIREAPSLDVVHLLESEGARVRAYDPAAMDRVRAEGVLPDVELCPDPYQLAQDADALVVVTEWNEFKNLDMERVRDALRRPIVVDGRNIYDPQRMHELGFTYWSVGRQSPRQAQARAETTGARWL